jgi:hypothetical protein
VTARIRILEDDDPDRHLDETAWDRSVAKGRMKPRPRDVGGIVVGPDSRIRKAIHRRLHYRVVPGSIGPTSRRLNDPDFDTDGEGDD